MSGYRFSKGEHGKFVATRVAPVHPDTEGAFINETSGQYGMAGPFRDVEWPWSVFSSRIGSESTWWEYKDGGSGLYYRVEMADIAAEIDGKQRSAEPLVLPVRHKAWPGMDETEIRIQLQERRKRRIEAAIKRARAVKAAREEQERREREEAALRERLTAEQEAEESEEDAILRALREAGLSEFA